MDAQSESHEPPPCDPQPPGKIRKALKMLSKRRQGGGMASIFSVRGKSDAGLKSSRSNTAEGLVDTATDTAASEADADSLDLDSDAQKNDAIQGDNRSREGNLASSSIRQSISSITSAKSLSFLTMIRKSRRSGQRQTQTESLRAGQTRKGLKGLFGNMRWHRRDKESGDEAIHDPGPPLLASRSNSVEIMKENLTLTPDPVHRSTEEPEPPTESQDDNPVSSEESTRPPTSDRLSSLLGDISSILNIEKMETGSGMMADVEAEWVKVSHRVETGADSGKDLVIVKATPSPKSTHSEFCPSTPLAEPGKQTPSPTTTKPFSSRSTPSPTPYPKHAQILPADSPITKPTLPSVPTPKASPVTVSRRIPVPVPVPASTPISPIASTLIPASPPTPEPSPKPSPTPSPASTPVDIPETPFSMTEKVYQEPVAIPEMSQPPKSKPAPKYPPFITSTKPMPAAPVARPKIVTTFGLSTSRNTAPITKPEIKSVPQTKSSPPASVCVKTPTDPESDSNSPPSVQTPAPFTRPSSSSATKGEKEQQNISSRKGLKEIPGGETYARAPPFYKPVKPVTLSKIPVSGGIRPKQPPRDAPQNTSNGHSNPSTPVEDVGQISFSRESSSKDLLSDASAQLDAVSPISSHEDILELSTYPGTGAASLSRESKIPIKHGSTATYTSLQGKMENAKSKIPISKVPVRRTGNKPAPSQK